MNILVTGSAGYIGGVLVPALRAAGHTVVGYDIGWYGPDRASRFWVNGDIRIPLVDPGWPDVVVHLAGLSNDPLGEISQTLTWDINLWGTVDMVRHHLAARHVVISSCAVYGQADDLCTEESAPNPQTTYASAKAKVDDWLARHDYDHIILRLGTVYGRSPNHRLDLVVNRMVHDAVTLGEVTVNGNAARPLTHIEDVASAILWATTSHRQDTYNIVGENIRMHALGVLVADATNARLNALPGGVDTRDYMASGEKALRAGWHPTRTVAGTLDSLIRAEQDDPSLGRIRLHQLRALIDEGAIDPKHLRFAA